MADTVKPTVIGRDELLWRMAERAWAHYYVQACKERIRKRLGVIAA